MSKKKESAQTAQSSAKKVTQVSAAARPQGGNFVTVMSKLPWGLTFATPDGKKHVINGMNQGLLVKTEGMLGRYAATRLDAEVWEYFAKAHAEQDYLKKKAIFAEVRESDAKAKAKELEKDVKTGMEQIDPKDVPGIQTADNMKSSQGVTA
jgi:hypothetical protein